METKKLNSWYDLEVFIKMIENDSKIIQMTKDKKIKFLNEKFFIMYVIVK